MTAGRATPMILETEVAAPPSGNLGPVTTELPDSPPPGRQGPTERPFHGDTVSDEFAWLAEKENPDTIAYLEGENAWTKRATAHLADLQDTAVREIKDPS